jgi:hypothetical protein
MKALATAGRAETGLTRTLACLIGAAIAAGAGLVADLAAVGFLTALVAVHRVKRIPDPATAFLASLVLALIPAWMISSGPSGEAWASAAAMFAAFGLYAAGLNLGAAAGLLRFLVVGLYGGTWARIAAGGGPELSPGVAALILVLASHLEPGRLRRWCLGTGVIAAGFAFWSGGPVIRAALVAGAACFGLFAWRDAHPKSFAIGALGLVASAIAVAIAWGPQIGSLVARDGIVSGYALEAWTGAAATFPYGAGIGRAAGLAGELGFIGLISFSVMIAIPLLRGRRIVASALGASLILLVAAPLHADRAFLLLLGASTVLSRAAAPVSVPNSEKFRRSTPSPEAIPCGA